MGKVLDSTKIGAIGEYIKDHTEEGAEICVSSDVFTIFAYQELMNVLNNCARFRFLYREPAFLNSETDDKKVKEFELQMKQREKDVSEYRLEIGLKNHLTQNLIALNCANFIRAKGEIKSVLQPGIVSSNNILVVNPDGSGFLINGSGFSFSKDGLGYASEVHYDFTTVNDEKEIVTQYANYFDSIFTNSSITVDVKSNLLNKITDIYKENSPQLVYYMTLYQLFKNSLLNTDDKARVKERTGITNTKVWNSLYNFQHDAVVGAIKKLELYNGCIIADSVGLGKTFEALAIIKYYELRNDRVLVLCPKKLRSNWTSFRENSVTNMLADDRFNYDVLNHTDLSRSHGKSGDINLETINWGNYDLVVIDESHNFRNNNVVKGKLTRYQKLMRDIIQSGVKTKVLMLSATPVNTKLTDLKNQIMFITEGKDDAFKETAGIDSVETTLRLAQQVFNKWAQLPEGQQNMNHLLPMLDYNFFNLLNVVTIARSRRHIQTYYDTKDIGQFPKRLKPITLRADIDLDKEFPPLQEANNKIAMLHLAMYSPMLYILPTRLKYYEEKYDQEVKGGVSSFKQADRERSIVNLMRVNLLKRLESSVNSFSLTVGRILGSIDAMLELLAKGGEYDYPNEETEDEDLEEAEIGGKIKVKVQDIDAIKMRQDLLEDKAILEELYSNARKVEPARDAKLQMLKQHISEKIEHPINGNNKKILVFTTFSDTAEYLYENLVEWLYEKYHLYTGLVTGGKGIDTNLPKVQKQFEGILAYFSPMSNHMRTDVPQIDLLIATDCISEGQNLQDCDYLINYDIHWNPVRIIQRFGRIDRIGSKNDVIQLVNFWPNMELDEYINLENRVKSRMVMLDVSATGDDDLLSTESKNLEYRKKQLKQLQSEVLDVEELQGGISITDLTLDDFVMSLQRFMDENPGVVENYPTGIYAVTDIDEKIKAECVPGVIFCLKQKKSTGQKEGANSLYPYYLVYVSEQGTIHIGNTSPKKCLDLYKALCQNKDGPIKRLTSAFNRKTHNGEDMSEYTDLLQTAVSDIKGYTEKQGVQSLFQIGQATLFDNMVQGVNDFELISFMVVKK